MDNLNFDDLRKKKVHLGIRISTAERKMLFEFCKREQISITDLVRYAIRKVIKEKSKR